MAERKNNKICVICKSHYSYCPTCSHDTDKPTWYAVFDGENCHDIYEICTSYRDKLIDKKVAYERISKCDLANLENFADSAKTMVNEILSYNTEFANDKKVVEKVESVKMQPKFYEKKTFEKESK